MGDMPARGGGYARSNTFALECHTFHKRRTSTSRTQRPTCSPWRWVSIFLVDVVVRMRHARSARCAMCARRAWCARCVGCARRCWCGGCVGCVCGHCDFLMFDVIGRHTTLLAARVARGHPTLIHAAHHHIGHVDIFQRWMKRMNV